MPRPPQAAPAPAKSSTPAASPRALAAAAKPRSVAAYIDAAPPEGQAMLRQLLALLRAEAPQAQVLIKWGAPFFVEPRFLFSFSAHQAHLNFAPMATALAAFRSELHGHRSTKNFLQIPYGTPLPEDLIRRIARHCVQTLRDRPDDAFWSRE